MGFGNIGWFQILVVLLIVLLVFGTKKIRNLGGDLGGAIRDFRKGVSEDADGDKSDQGDKAEDSSETTNEAAKSDDKPAAEKARDA